MTIVSRRRQKPEAPRDEFIEVESVVEIYIYHGNIQKKLSDEDEEAIQRVFDDIRKQLGGIS